MNTAHAGTDYNVGSERKTIMVDVDTYNAISDFARRAKVTRGAVIDVLRRLTNEEALAQALASRRAEKVSARSERELRRRLVKEIAATLSYERLCEIALESRP